ncbi:MAG: hypothetical protein ABFD18_12610 [Syntrophomonas sp.]
MYKGKQILLLDPHTDVELGCGTTTARLKTEFINAMNGILSLPLERLFIYNYPVHRLSYSMQVGQKK